VVCGGTLVWCPYQIISIGVMSCSLHLVLLLLVLSSGSCHQLGDPLLAKKIKHKNWTCMPWQLHYHQWIAVNTKKVIISFQDMVEAYQDMFSGKANQNFERERVQSYLTRPLCDKHVLQWCFRSECKWVRLFNPATESGFEYIRGHFNSTLTITITTDSFSISIFISFSMAVGLRIDQSSLFLTLMFSRYQLVPLITFPIL